MKKAFKVYVDSELIEAGKAMGINFSKFFNECLINFYAKEKIIPSEILEKIYNETEDKKEARSEKNRKLQHEFWKNVQAKRDMKAKDKYERIGRIIEAKERGEIISPFALSDEDKEYAEEMEGITDDEEVDELLIGEADEEG